MTGAGIVTESTGNIRQRETYPVVIAPSPWIIEL